MISYPKMYSISTVGIRQHGNTDFLLHSVRTDFVGNNHLGKSLIADLLQLIFVPLREEWKPGTEGIDERKIETIPLERPWISHAYCFLNIEKTQGKYLTIGVYIPTSSRIPIRPFIVQQGDNFENKNAPLKTFDNPLNANDFIADNQKILDLENLKRHLFESFGLYFKDFYQKDGINDYFDWLYRSQILHIDLTRETNLKSFAKVLQSFSKAKTLKIADSKSLQNFLFEDNDEIKTTFENKRDELTRHIRDYHKTDEDIKLLKKKQEELIKLKSTFNQFEDAKKDYLFKYANFQLQAKLKAEENYKNNETTKQNAWKEYKGAKNLYEEQIKKLYSKMLEQRAICNEIRNKLETEQAETGANTLEKLKTQLQIDKSFIERLETLVPILETEDSVEKINNIFAKQEIKIEQKTKLKQLKANEFFKQFEDSKWTEGYDVAYTFYNQRNLHVQSEIRNLSEILSLYEGSKPNSLFDWAVNQETELTIEQETILMAFKDIFTKQITANPGEKYTLKPEVLLNSFTKEGNGIWVHLGNVSEYVELVSEVRFNDKDKLRQAIANDKRAIQIKIDELKEEQKYIRNLNSIGLNKEIIDIYNQREHIEKYNINNLLTKENVKWIEANFNSFFEIEKLKKDVRKLDDKITIIIKKSGELEPELKYNGSILIDIQTSIAELKDELGSPIENDIQSWTSDDKDKLIKIRDKNKLLITNANKERNLTKSKQDDQKRKYDLADSQTESLKTLKETTEKNFTIAKQDFENETFLNFDQQLQMGELTDTLVDKAKEIFQKNQREYEQKYATVASSFDESKAESKNPELYDSNGKSNYNYKTLENVLCGRIGLSGVTNALTTLNEKLKTFAEFQMKILTNVFALVEKQYNEYDNTIRRLNFFFSEQKISNIFRFKIAFEPRKDINIDWIDKMKERSKVHKDGVDLFTLPENLPSAENTPENLIRTIANTFYRNSNADVTQLLNPKFYFTLKVAMEDEYGSKNSGSSGQAYTAIALLCIGRLSIVQKEQRKGLKFIILEELLNLDDTNFSIFPKIARELGYQLITMTTKPFGSYTNEEWYLHMLVKGKVKDENYIPMSWFKTKTSRTELYKYTQ